MAMNTRTNSSKAATSSLTIADWSAESAERGEKDAVRDTSLIGLVLKEITDALGRGDTVRISNGKPDLVSHREMVFRPKPRAGTEMAEPAQPAIRRNFADPMPETETYDVVQSEGSQAHVIVVPKDDPLGST